MTPGPELDAAVAKAIGENPEPHKWEQLACDIVNAVFHCQRCGLIVLDDQEPDGKCIPPYSTDLNAAFEAANRVALFESLALTKQVNGTWYFLDGDEATCCYECETPAHAICLAVLEVKKHE